MFPLVGHGNPGLTTLRFGCSFFPSFSNKPEPCVQKTVKPNKPQDRNSSRPQNQPPVIETGLGTARRSLPYSILRGHPKGGEGAPSPKKLFRASMSQHKQTSTSPLHAHIQKHKQTEQGQQPHNQTNKPIETQTPCELYIVTRSLKSTVLNTREVRSSKGKGGMSNEQESWANY